MSGGRALVQGILKPLIAKSESDLDDRLLPLARRGGRSAIWILGAIVALNNALVPRRSFLLSILRRHPG